MVVPQSLKDRRKQQWDYTCQTMQKRVDRAELHERSDFVDCMLKHKGEKDGLTDTELISNSNILIITGSETTATLLSGITYWLLKTPETLSKATHEVRSAFRSEDGIDFLSASAKLPYMLACLDEALRRYPPVPQMSHALSTRAKYSNQRVGDACRCKCSFLLCLHSIS